MNRIKISIFLLFTILLVSCSSDVNYIQDINIAVYDDEESNVKLAENLIYYDLRYLAENIQGFNEESAKGIKLGYFIRKSDSKPSFRITYSLTNPSVAKNFDTLKSNFDSFIKKIAVQHVDKNQIFVDLQPTTKNIIENFFLMNVDTIWKYGASSIRSNMKKGALVRNAESIIKEFGELSNVEYIRSQYYDAMLGKHELIAMHYKISTSKNKTGSMSITYQYEIDSWKIAGYRIAPI